MATKSIRSIKGRVARMCKLDQCGQPIHSSTSWITTSGFITVTIADEIEDGEEYTQKNAWGEFCESNPDVLTVMGAVTPVVFGGNTIGWTRGPNPAVSAFSLELWTKKAGQDACEAPITVTVTNKALTSNVATLTTGTVHGFQVGVPVTVTNVDATFNGTYVVASTPTTTTFTYAKTAANVVSAAAAGNAFQPASPEWGYFLLPFVKNGKLDGDIVIANAPLNITVAAEAYGADDWLTGPFGDNPFLQTFPNGEVYGQVVTTVQPPAATAGLQALA